MKPYIRWGNIVFLAVLLANLVMPAGTVQRALAEGAPPTQYIEADSQRHAKGITGYVVSEPTSHTGYVLVASQSRSADIYFERAPAEGIASIIVNVADSRESLTMTAIDPAHGSISVNGKVVASWAFQGGSNWVYSGFGALDSFTSWNILVDLLNDVNWGPGVAAATWLVILGVIVAMVAILVTAIGINLNYTQNFINNCVAQGSACQQPGYAPDNPACIYWFANCSHTTNFYNWCGQMEQQCTNGSQSACDLFNEHCPDPVPIP